MFIFWKIRRALFSRYLGFEIPFFALLPMICNFSFPRNNSQPENFMQDRIPGKRRVDKQE